MKRNALLTSLFLLLSCALFAQVNTAPFPNPVPQFFDANGAPLAGGRLLTFAAGTTTPLATYTDATGLIQNTNPIILNASGFPTNASGSIVGIWLGPQKYKIILQDVSMVQQWAVDQVGGNNLFSLANLNMAESTAPTCNVGFDILWGDSAGHRFKFCNNGGSPDFVVGANTTDTFTNKTSISENLVTPSINAPSITGSYSIIPTFMASGNQNNVLHVGGSVPGSGDIGVQINAAYAACPAKGCTIVIDPKADNSSYDFSTPIVLNTAGKPVLLVGSGACSAAGASAMANALNYTPLTGTAAITLDYMTTAQSSFGSMHGVANLCLVNNNFFTSGGQGSLATGISIPNVNGGIQGGGLFNVGVAGFGTQVSFLNNIGGNTFFYNLQIFACTVGIKVDRTTGLFIQGGTIGGCASAIQGVSTAAAEVTLQDTQFFSNDVIFDFTAAVSPSIVDAIGVHLENGRSSSAPAHFVQGDVDFRMIGGLMENDSTVGTQDWMVNTGGNEILLSNVKFVSAGTVTSIVVANAPVRGSISGFNNSAGHFTNFVTGANATKVTQMILAGPSGTASTPWLMESALGFLNATLPSAVANYNVCGGDGGGGNVLKCAYNGGSFFQMTQTIGTGTSTSNGTIINAGTSQAQPAITITGATTTDVATCSLNAAPVATWQTGIQLLPAVVTANTVTPWLSNPTAGNITPAAAVIRCTVIR